MCGSVEFEILPIVIRMQCECGEILEFEYDEEVVCPKCEVVYALTPDSIMAIESLLESIMEEIEVEEV